MNRGQRLGLRLLTGTTQAMSDILATEMEGDVSRNKHTTNYKKKTNLYTHTFYTCTHRNNTSIKTFAKNYLHTTQLEEAAA